MKKFKLKKDLLKRISTIMLSGLIIGSLWYNTGCTSGTESKDEKSTITSNDTVKSVKEMVDNVFTNASTEVTRLCGKNKKLDKDYLNLTQELVKKRSEIYKLIKDNAVDTAIVNEYTNFMEYSVNCKLVVDSLLENNN